MTHGTLLLEAGTLWERLTAATGHALSRGALQSLPTQCEFVEQGGIRFLVRVLASLARKDEAQEKSGAAASGKEFNPFLPYEEDLFVTDISGTHVCLLNKFNVLNHHLLIVTRTFENQESLLTLPDCEALCACMAEFEGLAFYNAGQTAGASQRHKHLQVVPLPLVAEGPRIPIEPALAAAHFEGLVGTSPGFPFVHAIARLEPAVTKSPREAAAALCEGYHALLDAVVPRGGAYNLLATRQWLLLVPRSQACFESIAINALGFAGALLVRNQQQLQVLKERGPLTVLSRVAVSPLRESG